MNFTNMILVGLRKPTLLHSDKLRELAMFNIRSSELVLSLFLALVTLAMPPVSAAEQTYPSQNIRFIVPYGVGGGRS